jgi:hypothetical protein
MLERLNQNIVTEIKLQEIEHALNNYKDIYMLKR